ncbi:MAG: glycine oxidase ThiO [Myxococcales bacterium]|nr:glycine oxidase ThiO [Myxococcales bacterium]
MARPSVLIVGGGLMGCASAWQLAKRGCSVVVLERSIPGAEASSAAAGILGGQVESHELDAMTELCLQSRSLYPAWAKGLARATGIDIELRPSGTMRVAFGKERLDQLKRQFGWQRRHLGAAFLGKRALRTLEPRLSQSLAGAVDFPEDSRVDPRKLFRALQLAAQSAGATFRSGSYVQALDIDDTSQRVRGVVLEGGTRLAAERVVLAAGSWSTLIPGVPLPRPSIVPARGQVLELTCRTPPLTRIVFGPRCYLVPRDDGRVLVGSTLEFVGYEKRVTAKAVRELLDAAIDLCPALADAELSDSWSNFRPYTPDHWPILGDCAVDGLVLATGHYRNGILLAPITAEIVTRCVLGQEPRANIAAFSARRVAVQS